MPWFMSRRARAALLACMVIALGPMTHASGDAILQQARKQREATKSHLGTHRKHLRILSRESSFLGKLVRIRSAQGEYPRRMMVLIRQRAATGRAVTHQRRLIRRLSRGRKRLAVVIDRLAPLKVCPVRGFEAISDDFGVMRIEPTPHAHMGNDIPAPYGAPIVAPFDGLAVAVTSDLGGLGVKVYGPYGHAYNAHLSALGTLGGVKAGTVIGYVGTSGDATSSHDHFEWHPGNGPAVDPHIYLLRACYP